MFIVSERNFTEDDIEPITLHIIVTFSLFLLFSNW